MLKPSSLNIAFNIPGSKVRLAKKIISLMPSHEGYIEVFGGSASVLLLKPPSKFEVYNDIDEWLTNFFRVLRDPQKFHRFYRMLYYTPYSRLEVKLASEKIYIEDDDVKKALWFYILIRQTVRAGREQTNLRNWSADHDGKHVRQWQNAKKKLKIIHQRLQNVMIEQRDFREVINYWNQPNNLMYLDPPYYPDTRKSVAYRFEMTQKDYEDLFELLLNLKCKAILSGYRHPAFEVLEKNGWQRVDIGLRNSGVPGKPVLERVESIWINYEKGLL